MKFLNIPLELRERPQWVAWHAVKRNGKDTKLPINPHTGRLARTNDSSTWGTFEQAVAMGENLSGIGYVFSDDDPYCGIDLDSEPDSDLLHWFNSYTERSVSGRGAHIIVRAQVAKGCHLEHGIFSTGRYFCCTGDVMMARPIREAQAEVDAFLAHMRGDEQPSLFDGCVEAAQASVLDLIRTSPQAGKFERLWAGDTSGYHSGSEADAALLAILRYWTCGDRDESFRLFSGSALALRKNGQKWARQDYRERTWAALTGAVGTMPARRLAVTLPATIVADVAPWRKVTNADVRKAIAGTMLEPLVELFASPMNPPLPLEMSLLKAIVVAGCALSGRDDTPADESLLVTSTRKGHELARLSIMTADGQGCNIYGLLVGRSGIGKDVGGLMDKIMLANGWMIGTGGSAEGIADILSMDGKGGGYIGIEEFSTWLDKRNWQSKAAAFLTSAFGRGWFSVMLSKRGKDNGLRSCDYCVPSILANIQPAAMSQYASLIDLGTGFLGRFVVVKMPDDYHGRPVCRRLDIGYAAEAVGCFLAKRGIVEVADGYLQDLYDEFREHKAAVPSHWGRLVNQYGPRLAVMLSVHDDSEKVVLTDEAWDGAATLLRWFYSQGERVLGAIHEDEQTAKRESLFEKIYARIARNGSATLIEITRSTRRGTTRHERAEAIEELIARGVIQIRQGTNGVAYETTGRD